jgi:F0F1-type ATP synthase membrane subunit b/b'
LLNGTLNGTLNRRLNGKARARTSGAPTDERRSREIQDDMRRGSGMRVCSKSTALFAAAVGGDVRPGAGQASRFATPALIALLLTASARSAHASETLNLIPDYAFFGLLQLGLIPDESGLGALWVMLVAFALLVLPLNALIFQPIFRALDSRAERIQGARQRSEHLQREADSILERYESAVRETRGVAEAARQVELGRAREEQAALTSQAKLEAERQLERARADLAQSLESARAGLRASADDLARAAAEQVLGRALS